MNIFAKPGLRRPLSLIPLFLAGALSAQIVPPVPAPLPTPKDSAMADPKPVNAAVTGPATAAPTRIALGIELSQGIDQPKLDRLLSDFANFRLTIASTQMMLEYEAGYSYQNSDIKTGSDALEEKTTQTAHFFRGGLAVYRKWDMPLLTVYLGPKYQYQRAIAKIDDPAGGSREVMNYHDFMGVLGLEKRFAGSFGIAGEFQGVYVIASGDSRGFGDKEVSGVVFQDMAAVVFRWYVH